MSEPVVQLELQSDNAKRVWARTAQSAGLVALGFVLMVAAIMMANYVREQRLNPLTIGQIAALKAQLTDRPDDESIKQQIRELDLQIRQSYFHGRTLASRGGYLILGGTIVLLIALKLAAALQAEPYLPDPEAVLRHQQPWVSSLARRTIGGFALVLAGVLIALAAMPRYRLPEFALAKAGSSGDAPPPQATLATTELPSIEQFMRNWPAFRGPTGSGVAAGDGYPTEWDAASGKNILWKAEVPLPGNNSPVVWEKYLFLAGGTQDKREVYCFDADTGKLLWRQVVGGPVQLELMEDTGFAPCTLATDGRRVFAMFPTGELAAFNFTGKPAWAKNLGVPKNIYGHAASLVTHKGKLIVQLDQGNTPRDADSSIMAFDGLTGKLLWQTKRDMASSWSSPIVAHLPKGDQIITCGHPFVIAYEPETGKEIWKAKLLDGEIAPSPIYRGDVVYVCNDRSVLAAIRTDGQGDVTATHVTWTMDYNLPDIVSPLCTDEVVYMIMTSGILTCCDAKNGEMLWEKELDTEVKASPVLAGDRIYMLDTQGVMHIFQAGREFKEIAKASIDEEAYASPAFVGGRIYIRGKHNLYCIGPKP